MTETPSTPEPENTPEHEAATSEEQAPAERAKKRRRKRSLLRTVAVFTGIGIGALVGVGVIALVGGRYYLLSDAGRGLVTSFIAGKKIGRYGAIKVEGVKGDLFDDFTIDKITVTDINGAWLTAEDVRVDWSFWPLVMRRFHADEITAKSINVLRRPVLEPPTEPSGPMPISVDIDKFATDIHLMEDFSKEYGHWRLSGDANIPRNGAKKANVDARSLSRPGDFLKLAATFSDKPEELRLNLQAQEAMGGPLAGAMGYSPDVPFSAVAVVDGNRADIVMKTGNFTPLSVKGRFAEEGSRLSGYMDFSGSDLLAPFIDRIGRTARIGFAAFPDKQREGVQNIGWRLIADNIQSSASGSVLTKGGMKAENIALEVATPSLSRLAGMKLADATSFKGVFSGDASEFSLKGDLAAENAEVTEYRMARLAGPVELSATRGEYNLQGQLRAAGASTDGMIGGLLGSAPSLDVSLSMLKDGAILLRKIDLQGQAASLTGSGGRNLAGGLKFDGDIALKDLSRLSPKAKGAFNARISANSPRARAPWSLSLDGTGNRIKTGFAEADRLLGDRPKLKLSGSLNQGVLSVTQGRLDGDKNTFVNAMGQFNNGNLALKLNWNAAGEFLIGPISIPESIRGSGALTGSLNYPVVNLRSDFKQIRLADNVSLDNAMLAVNYSKRPHANQTNGFVDLRGTMGGHPAYARSFYSFIPDGIRLSDLNVNAGGVRAAGSVTLTGSTPSRANLRVSARPGALVQSGWLDGTVKLVENEPSAINIRGRNLRIAGVNIPINTVDVAGTGSLERLELTTLNIGIGGALPVQYNGSLIYENAGDQHSFYPVGTVALRGQTLRAAAPSYVRINKDRVYADLPLTNATGARVVHLTAKDGARSGFGYDRHSWHLHADLNGLPISLLVPDMRGNISGEVLVGDAGQYLSGTTRGLKLDNLATSDAEGSNATSVDLNVQATLDANDLKLLVNSPLLNNAGSTPNASNLDVTVPVTNTGSLFGLGVNMDGPLSGMVRTNGQIGPLWNLFDGLDRKMSGRLTTALTISGTPKAPSIDGAIHLRDGTFEDVATGALIRKLNLDAHASNNGVSVQHLSGNDFSQGTLCGYGYVALRPGYRQTRVESELPPCEGWQADNARNARISSGGLTVDLNNFRIVRSETATVVASGKINALHNGSVINLTGRLDVNSAEISPTFPPSTGITRMDVVEYNRPAHLPPLQRAAARPTSGNGQSNASGFSDLGRTPVRLNVNLNAESIMVRGRGLDLMLSSNASIQGSLTSPRLNGRAEVVRGTYEFGGKRFSFDPSGYATLDTSPERIRLNLSARREDADITAVINVTGTAAMPRIELTSEPELPQDEILARVLFGRSVTQLSAIEAAQLASSVASLAGGGGLDVLGGLRQLAQLDSLSFSGDGTDLMISGGRRIGKNLFLEVQSGGRNGPAINVEWQVRNNVAVTSTMEGDGDAIISVRWRKPSN